MPEEKITKEELIKIFDECQEAFDRYADAQRTKNHASTLEANARIAYEQAKAKWNKANEKFTKELNRI